MKNIAVAVDLSHGVEELMHKAYEMSQLYKAKIWLIHIEAPQPVMIDVYSFNEADLMINQREKMLKQVHAQLEIYRKELVAEGVDVDVVSVEGNAAILLLQEIEKHTIDLLIIGNRKHGFFYKTMIGSIFDEVIKKIEIPVLAVPIE
jgi:nucleotide-binding universal stress UspA family protein